MLTLVIDSATDTVRIAALWRAACLAVLGRTDVVGAPEFARDGQSDSDLLATMTAWLRAAHSDRRAHVGALALVAAASWELVGHGLTSGAHLMTWGPRVAAWEAQGLDDSAILAHIRAGFSAAPVAPAATRTHRSRRAA